MPTLSSSRNLLSSSFGLKAIPVIALCVLIFCSAIAQAKTIVVGVIKHTSDFQNVGTNSVEEIFTGELQSLTEGEFDVEFKSFVADWTVESTRTELNRVFADTGVDMVLAVGFLANQVAVSRDRFEKPTFLPLVINGDLLGAPAEGNSSGKANLNYLVDSVPFREDISSFQRVVPFDSFVLLTDQAILETLHLASEMIALEAPGLEVALVTHDRLDEDLLSKLPASTEAILLGGLPRLDTVQFEQLLADLADRGIPVFSQSHNEVHLGALASDAIDTDFTRIARRNALNMQAVLLGEQAADQPIFFDGKRQLSINMSTVETLGISPRFDVLSEANLVNEPIAEGPRLDLRAVADLVVERNLGIVSETLAVQIGETNVAGARAGLLPQLGFSANSLVRDESPAVQAGGLPERSNDTALSLSQTLYSDSQLSTLVQEKYTQQGRQFTLDAVRLDAIQEATIAYLQALRSETQLSIQQDNLSLTRANLDLAQDRVRVGSANNADIYRWESNLASAQASVLSAVAGRAQARESLNRVLNRPLHEQFQLIPADAQEPFAMSEAEFTRLVNNRRSFERFTHFNVDFGLSLAPELAQLEAQLAATQRDVVSRKRARWLPDFDVQAQYSDNLNTSGLGDGGLGEGISDWNVTLSATLPIFTGGARRSALSRARLLEQQIRVQIRDTTERIAQNIRANMYATQASYANIELSERGAVAAKKNLELVADSYRSGNTGIVDLLDAQTQSVQADLSANNAVHDFLIDVMNMQRAIGQFEFLMTPQDRIEYNDAIRASLNTPLQTPGSQ